MAKVSLWSFEANIEQWTRMLQKADKLRAFVYTEEDRKLVHSLAQLQNYCQGNLAFEINGTIEGLSFRITAMPDDFPWSGKLLNPDDLDIMSSKWRDWRRTASSSGAFSSRKPRYTYKEPATLSVWAEEENFPFSDTFPFSDMLEWAKAHFICPESLIVRGGMNADPAFFPIGGYPGVNPWLYSELTHSWPKYINRTWPPPCAYYIVSSNCDDAAAFKAKASWYEETGGLLYFQASDEAMADSIMELVQHSDEEYQRLLDEHYPEI